MELKHGRVAMLACLGTLVQCECFVGWIKAGMGYGIRPHQFAHLPLFSYLPTCLPALTAFTHLPDDVFSNPRPLGALSQVLTERPVAALQIVLFITGIELTAGKQDPLKAPGQLGRFGEAFKPEGEEEMAAVQLRELKNGRLAMVRPESQSQGGGVCMHAWMS